MYRLKIAPELLFRGCDWLIYFTLKDYHTLQGISSWKIAQDFRVEIVQFCRTCFCLRWVWYFCKVQRLLALPLFTLWLHDSIVFYTLQVAILYHKVLICAGFSGVCCGLMFWKFGKVVVLRKNHVFIFFWFFCLCKVYKSLDHG